MYIGLTLLMKNIDSELNLSMYISFNSSTLNKYSVCNCTIRVLLL